MLKINCIIHMAVSFIYSASLYAAEGGEMILDKRDGFIPVLSESKLHAAWQKMGGAGNLLGRTVIVTGMLSRASKSGECFRLHLYNGKILCMPESSCDQNFIDVNKFFEGEEKLKKQDARNYMNWMAKITVKGVLSKHEKLNVVSLKNCKIISWYGVEVSAGNCYYGLSRRDFRNLPSEFTNGEKADYAGGTLRFNRVTGMYAALPVFKVGEAATAIDGLVKRSVDTINGSRLELIKKGSFDADTDPFSFFTEIEIIDTIMRQRKYAEKFMVSLAARETDRTLQGWLKLYDCAEVTNWQSAASEVALYKFHRPVMFTVSVDKLPNDCHFDPDKALRSNAPYIVDSRDEKICSRAMGLIQNCSERANNMKAIWALMKLIRDVAGEACFYEKEKKEMKRKQSSTRAYYATSSDILGDYIATDFADIVNNAGKFIDNINLARVKKAPPEPAEMKIPDEAFLKSIENRIAEHKGAGNEGLAEKYSMYLEYFRSRGETNVEKIFSID